MIWHAKIPKYLWSSALFPDLAFPHLVNLFLEYGPLSSLDFFYVLHTTIFHLPIRELVIFSNFILP